MASVFVKADFTLDTRQILDGLAHLNTAELEEFYEGVGRLLKRRRGDADGSPSFPIVDGFVDSAVDESSLPIVEALIPKSITLDGDSVCF